MRQHFERGAFGLGGGDRRRNEIVAPHARLFHARIGQRDGARPGGRRLLRANALRRDRRLWRNVAIGLFHHRADAVGADIACNDQRRVVRCVEALVEGERILAVEFLDLLMPADGRAAIGMIEIQRGHDLFGQPRIGAVADAHVVFFQHHVALGQHVFILEDEAGHAVGLELHHGRKLVARHALEVGGVVGGGEGVLVAADPRDELREFSRRMLGGALEHQVFEKMREAGFPRRLVGGADLVPDHLGDDGRAPVGNDHDLKAVAEGECRRPLPCGLLRAGALGYERSA